jgi:hypothetical protein
VVLMHRKQLSENSCSSALKNQGSNQDFFFSQFNLENSICEHTYLYFFFGISVQWNNLLAQRLGDAVIYTGKRLLLSRRSALVYIVTWTVKAVSSPCRAGPRRARCYTELR